MAVIIPPSEGTGSTAIPARDVVVPFDRYEITVRLGPAKEFLGVIQVAVRKDFLSQSQRITADDSLNASELYER